MMPEEEEKIISIEIDMASIKTEEDEMNAIKAVQAILRTFRKEGVFQGPDQAFCATPQGDALSSESLIGQSPVTERDGPHADSGGALAGPSPKVVVFPSVMMQGNVPVRAFGKVFFVCLDDVRTEAFSI